MMPVAMTESVEDRLGDPGEDDASPSLEGTPQLSRYTILQKLAVGGMAEIFVAQKHGSPDVCVVKQLHAHLSKDTVVGARFLREAQVAALLDHPHIAKLTDARREDNGAFYLAMEFIPGQDVETMMFRLMEQRKMLPPELSMTVTLDVLEGLHYAHEKKGPDGRSLEIVHRDLSPRNVMLTYDGRVKIIDFGLARTNLGDFRTAPGMVLGTMRYMSPEQAVAEPVDRRSDIYSWSVVLYEMLSGRPLVMGANAQEVLHHVVTQMPPPLSSLNPTLPKALDAVLERGLAKNRNERFNTAEELRQALLAAAGSLASLDDERHQLIGRFARELFPQEHSETTAMLESIERGEGGFEPTRLGPAQHEVTRALYVQRLQSMAGADTPGMPEVVHLSNANATRLRVHDPVAGSVPGTNPGTKAVYPPQPVPSKAVMYLLVGCVALAMFLAGGAAVWMLLSEEQEVVVAELPDSQAPVAVKVEQKQKETPAAELPQKAVEPVQAAQPKREEKRVLRREEKTSETKIAAAVKPGEIGEVESKERVFDDVYQALRRARREIEKMSADQQADAEPKSLTEALEAIRAHQNSVPEGKRSGVKNCLMAIDFASGWSEKLDKLETCYRKLEDGAR
jgi:serine/threonine-protein kinase